MLKKILVMFSLLFGTTFLFAGSAIIPNWRHNGITTYCLYVSNINDLDVEVNITLYKKDGTVYTGTYTQYGAELNKPFILSTNSTGSLCIDKISGAQDHGYGIIKGSPVNGKGTVQLVAFAVDSDTAYNNRWYSIPINGGLPF
ncbi:hypothetical protein CRV08_09515 [Halarcobacter ebronensis]|uniref:DUF4352 domain-containing protein n=1 Tax=Halarcobacter ebronensis TaxID=1462615 RepID=A0A4Q0YCC9_9BACT|nr:hypothetical protein [Halarcobacter ebronensis]RXJ68036.1 hypothetical protein CRV08_09515 [Halarcobacter ebronensis]